jgi:cyclopropane fatty-acyl-phospholipid synthase-like methyltransferase
MRRRNSYLHYGIFEHENEPLITAQERSTELLLSRLPPPPCSVLEVGIGLGTTMAFLAIQGYDVRGITPDEHQIAMVREKYEGLGVRCAVFETLDAGRTFDVILFQESSQYIDSEALFARAESLAPRVLVIDEFALKPLDEEGALRSLEGFLAAAARHGFRVTEEIDLSAKAAPTMDYFTNRIPQYREKLIADLGITSEQIDNLIENGGKYRARYAEACTATDCSFERLRGDVGAGNTCFRIRHFEQRARWCKAEAHSAPNIPPPPTNGGRAISPPSRISRNRSRETVVSIVRRD